MVTEDVFVFSLVDSRTLFPPLEYRVIWSYLKLYGFPLECRFCSNHSLGTKALISILLCTFVVSLSPKYFNSVPWNCFLCMSFEGHELLGWQRQVIGFIRLWTILGLSLECSWTILGLSLECWGFGELSQFLQSTESLKPSARWILSEPVFFSFTNIIWSWVFLYWPGKQVATLLFLRKDSCFPLKNKWVNTHGSNWTTNAMGQ